MTTSHAGPPGGPHSVRRRAALLLLVVAIGFTSVYVIAAAITGDTQTPVLPPAGERMQAEAPFTFAVLGDNRGNMTVFEEILGRIKRDGVGLILHTGDIVQRCTPAQYNWTLREIAEEKLQVPFCVAPGNHDLEDPDAESPTYAALYERSFGPRQYWFAYANTLFVAVDDSSSVCTRQTIRWLDRTLTDERPRYAACFVYLHVPPRNPLRPEDPAHHALREGADALVRVLKKHRVSALLAGHIHAYAVDNIEGIPVFITGGAGARLEAGQHHHYLLCTVRPDGSFAVVKRVVPPQKDEDRAEYILLVKAPRFRYLVIGWATGMAALAVWLIPLGRRGRSRPGSPSCRAAAPRGVRGDAEGA